MTERKENVEPPLAIRRTQITVLLLASVALISLSLTVWSDSSSPLLQPIPTIPKTGLHGKAVLRIDLNSAEPRELALLPGVGSTLANRIADNRIRMGPFETVDELTRVHGLGPKTLSQIRKICMVRSKPNVLRNEESLASLNDHVEPE